MGAGASSHPFAGGHETCTFPLPRSSYQSCNVGGSHLEVMRVISSSLACNDEMLETDGKAEGHLMVKSTRPPVDRPPFFCTILGSYSLYPD